jgi:hypothetical protein
MSEKLEQPDKHKKNGQRDLFFLILMYDTGASASEATYLETFTRNASLQEWDAASSGCRMARSCKYGDNKTVLCKCGYYNEKVGISGVGGR